MEHSQHSSSQSRGSSKSGSPSSWHSSESRDSNSTIVGATAHEGVRGEFDRLSLLSSSDSELSDEGDRLFSFLLDSSVNSEYSFTAHALNDPEKAAQYDGKLKFALKLGYSEEQVRLAIGKVGLGAVKNDFLNQLIRIGARVGSEGGHVARIGVTERASNQTEI